MSSTLITRGLVAASATIVALGALSASPAQAETVTLADAGQVVGWDLTGQGRTVPIPDEVDGVPVVRLQQTKGALGLLTANGTVAFATDDEFFEDPSDELEGKRIAHLAGNAVVGIALTDTDEYIFWGNETSPLATPGSADLSGVADITVGGDFAVGLNADHTLVAWGGDAYAQVSDTPTLSDVTKVVAGTSHAYALRENGTVAAWGRNQQGQTTLPPELTQEHNVKDIAARAAGGLALLADGSVLSWGQRATGANAVPPSLNGKTVQTITASIYGDQNLAIDSDGELTYWGAAAQLPVGLDGRTLSSVNLSGGWLYAIERAVLPVADSTIAGVAKEGETLTGTPATFSGVPDVVGTEWLADGTPIADETGTALRLTAAQVGKKITFRTTATTADGDVVSDSQPTAAVAGLAPVAIATKTVVKKVKVKKSKATIKVKITADSGTPTGKVKVTVKKGKKALFSKKVGLKKGVAKVVLKKLKKGKYKVVAEYPGAGKYKPSKGKGKFAAKK